MSDLTTAIYLRAIASKLIEETELLQGIHIIATESNFSLGSPTYPALGGLEELARDIYDDADILMGLTL